MSGRIYPDNKEKFVQISDKGLAEKMLTDYKDLIDIIARQPSELHFHIKDGVLMNTPFNAATYEFNIFSELGIFLEEKSFNNYISPYQVTHSGNKIRLRVILIPIEYNLIGLEGPKKRKIRISKIDKILED